jgi:hypothetical protein
MAASAHVAILRGSPLGAERLRMTVMNEKSYLRLRWRAGTSTAAVRYGAADALVRGTRALSDSTESESALGFLILSHFLRKTGAHFSGKCSN